MRIKYIWLALATLILLYISSSYSVLAASSNSQNALASYSHNIAIKSTFRENAVYTNIITASIIVVLIFSLFCGHIVYQTFKDKPDDQGGDLRLDLQLGFYDAMIGCKKEITIPRFEVNSDNQFLEVHRSLKVNIPAGSVDGDRLRLVGEGDTSKKGGRPGDLFILIIVPSDLN
jgi:DnaJ-class molecular chaperone